MSSPHRLDPGKSISIEDLSTSGRDFCTDREAAKQERTSLQEEMYDLQQRLYAAQDQRLLVVLQAMDAGGKDGTIRRVFERVDPRGVRVSSFKAPSKKELDRDYLWRIHQEVPAAGMIGIFNRSHYEDVLAVRVQELVPEETWRARYEQINQFEALLTETGTTVVKFFLHISKDEQKERFQKRLDQPEKNWKFSVDDLAKREDWDDYMKAFEEILNRCTTVAAPWYAIPADQKWYRNLAITRVLVDTLKQMDPQYPPPEPGLDKIQVT
ncbi:MAG: polyphosphate kinase 2 family protein [Pirellulaceae bacterium]